MFMANSARMSEISSAVINRNMSHSAFRLYVLLVLAADRSVPDGGFTPVSYEALTKTLPGVKGKPVVLSTIRENLRELRKAGLVETASMASGEYALIRLIGPDYTNPHSVGSQILYVKDSPR